MSDPKLPVDPASDDAYALFQRGQALLADQHWAQAVVSLEKAKLLEPDKTSIREALGRAYFRSGRYRQAADEFTVVVDQNPVNDFAHFCLGRSLQKLSDHKAARRHLKLAVGMRPDREDYRLYLDRGYYRRPTDSEPERQLSPDEIEVVRRFHELFYAVGLESGSSWRDTRWLGLPCLKSPFDTWVYQEIIYHKRPDVIVETGTAFGGSALYLASVCSLVGNGRVITVDVSDERHHERPHDLITYIAGSSTSPEVVSVISAAIAAGETVMVILDSDHRRDHVLEELRLYAPLVSPGHYLIIEDTNFNAHPVRPEFGPGPMEAVQEFLAERHDFIVDRSCEKYLMTFNPGGYLLREQSIPAA